MKNTLLASGIAAAVVALLVSVIVPGQPGPAGRDGRDGSSLGSVAGPDLPYPYFAVNGGRIWTAHTVSFTAATTTPLSIQNPSAGTTTLMLGSGCYFTTASTSAKSIRFYRAAVPNATTTFLFGASSGANATPTVAATTSTDNFIIGPTQWINMDMIGGTGVDSPAGTCVFRFMQLDV